MPRVYWLVLGAACLASCVLCWTARVDQYWLPFLRVLFVVLFAVTALCAYQFAVSF